MKESPREEIETKLNSLLTELIVPWDTSDLPPNIKLASPSLKIQQAQQEILKLLADQQRLARIDELSKMYKDWGEHSLIPWEDYIEARIAELKGSDKEGI